MNESKFEQYLKNGLKEMELDFPLHFFEETTSTNDLAKAFIKPQSIHGTLFIARKQNAGRGTYGRSFISKSGGIYCSLLIHVKEWHFKNIDLATIFAAVAVREAVHDVLGLQLELKWVNDLFLQGRKVGGILTEKQFDSNWLVIGIGLNVSNRLEEFPDELKQIVTTIGIDDPDDRIKAMLVVTIINYILKKGKLSCKNEVMRCYLKNLFILNQQVEISYGSDLLQVHVLGVNDSGQLIVQKSCGDILYLQAGEVKLNLLKLAKKEVKDKKFALEKNN